VIVYEVHSNMSEIGGADNHRVPVDAEKAGSASPAAPKVDWLLLASLYYPPGVTVAVPKRPYWHYIDRRRTVMVCYDYFAGL